MNYIYLFIGLVYSGKQYNKNREQEINTKLIETMDYEMEKSLFLVNSILEDPKFTALKSSENDKTKDLYHKVLIHIKNMKGLIKQWNTKNLIKTEEYKNETDSRLINEARVHDIYLLKDTKSKLELENRFVVDEANEEWLNTYIEKIKSVCVSTITEIEKVISELKKPLQDSSNYSDETTTKEKKRLIKCF